MTALVLLAGGISVAIYFRYQIENGFSVLNGDRYDQVIAISVFEHWRNTFLGLAHWSETAYFYPAKNTLAYNDGYFLYGAIYSVFRVFGIDPYLSGELVNVVTRTIGFFGFYAMARRVFALAIGWALFGAVLFTISDNIFIHGEHTQLLAVSFAPVMAVLIQETVASISRRHTGAILLWGLAAAAFFAVWLMTAFYMAWFFTFFCISLFIVYLLMRGRQAIKAPYAAIQGQLVPVGIVAAAGVLFNIPLLALYLPKARETGMHSFSEVFNFTLAPLDIVRTGDSNLLYGRIVALMDSMLPAGFVSGPGWDDGFPFILLFCFGCGAVWFWKSLKAAPGAREILLCFVAATTVATWIAAVRVGDVTLWWLVYHLFPGAKVPRVVSSYQIFLTVPVIVVAISYLSQLSPRIAGPILALVCVLLFVEELNTAPSLAIQHSHEVDRLTAASHPPRECRSFIVTHERPEGLYPNMDASYSHNIDAMIVAEVTHVPTLNGMSTFVPPGWNLTAPEAPDYISRVKSWVALHPVSGLCALDLRSLTWSTKPFG